VSRTTKNKRESENRGKSRCSTERAINQAHCRPVIIAIIVPIMQNTLHNSRVIYNRLQLPRINDRVRQRFAIFRDDRHANRKSVGDTRVCSGSPRWESSRGFLGSRIFPLRANRATYRAVESIGFRRRADAAAARKSRRRNALSVTGAEDLRWRECTFINCTTARGHKSDSPSAAECDTLACACVRESAQSAG